MTSEPTIDDVRRVYERHETSYGYAPMKRIGIGWVEDIDDEIPAMLPPPPEDPKDIINWGKPHKSYLESERVWQREKLHPEWQDSEIRRKAKIYNNDPRWFEILDENGVPKYASVEMLEYAARHWKMRKEGVYILIGDELVYLTGLHWSYLQWSKIGGIYPEYRELDLYFFYAVESVTKNNRIAGMTFLKGRRVGATFKALWYVLEFATRSANTNSFISSNTLEHCKKVLYKEKLLPMYETLPAFFKPFSNGYDKPQNGFMFDSPPRKGVGQLDQRAGLKSNITIIKNPDGSKLHRALVDESAKKKDVDIYEEVKVITPTMVDEGRFIGKMLLPTTMEEVNSEIAIGAYRRLWNDSYPSKAKKSTIKTTPSRLANLFFPAWFGLYDDISFVGRFGEAIISKPTKEQYEWLCNTYKEDEYDPWGNTGTNSDIWKNHGSWSYLKQRRKEMESDGKALASELRKYPFTVEEAFRPSVGSAIIDPLAVGNALADLHKVMPDGRLRHEHVRVRGNIIGEPGAFQFKEDKHGVFDISRPFLDFMASPKAKELGYAFNGIVRCPDGWRPALKRFIIGLDPIDMDKEHRTTSKLSDMCAMAFWPFDRTLDSDTYMEGGARSMVSHSFIARYRQRHQSKRVDFQNVLNLAMWLGCEIFLEMNRGSSFKDFMREKGALWFKASTPKEAVKPKGTMGVKIPVDTFTSDHLHNTGKDKINEWVIEFGSAFSLPFVETWSEFASVDLSDLSPFDEFVAAEYALLKGAPGVVSPLEKKSDIAQRRTGAESNSVYDAFVA